MQSDCGAEEVSHANNCLSSRRKEDRKEGANLICNVLRKCDGDIFQQYAETWAKLLLQVIQCGDRSNDEFEVKRVACLAMDRLLHFSVAFPELSRSFSVSTLPTLVTHLLTFPDRWKNLTLRMLITCMNMYPGPCGVPHIRRNIEQAVLHWLLDSELACKAYGYLPQCSGTGKSGEKYTVAWTVSFNKLLVSLSDCLDELYGFVETAVDKPYLDASGLVFPEIPEIEPARTATLAQRLKSICMSISQMLRRSFPASIEIEVGTVVQIICRVMAVSPDFLLARPTQDRIRLAEIIPSLHVAALGMLNSLVKFVGTNIVPYSSEIHQIYSQTILWIRKSQPTVKYGSDWPYAAFETELWNSIIIWLETLGGCSGIEDDTADDLLKAVVQITAPVKDTVTQEQHSQKLAEVSSMFHGQKSKGKKRRQNNQDSAQLSSQRKLNYTANWELLTSAWHAASLIIREVGVFIAPSSYQAVYSVLCAVLDAVEPPIPYGHPKCLSAAYSALLALVKYPNPSWPPPIQKATQLFSRHQDNPTVQNLCRESLLSCVSIMHLGVAPPQSPLSAPTETKQPQQQNYVLPSLAWNSAKTLAVNAENEMEQSESIAEQPENVDSDGSDEEEEMEEDLGSPGQHDAEETEIENTSPIPEESDLEEEETKSKELNEKENEGMEEVKSKELEEMKSKDTKITNHNGAGDIDKTSTLSNHLKRKCSEEEQESDRKAAKCDDDEDGEDVRLMLDAFVPV